MFSLRMPVVPVIIIRTDVKLIAREMPSKIPIIIILFPEVFL